MYQGAETSISSKDDVHDFNELQKAMNLLEFTDNEQNTIFRMLASVLYLGNIVFESVPVH